MFERFSGDARRAIVMAQEEARLLRHTYIGTEHLLLGLLRVADGGAARALIAAGATLDAARAQVEQTIGKGLKEPAGHIPFTARGKTALELSLRQAQELGHNLIGTEHILLGLLAEGEGTGVHALVALDVDLGRLRQHVIVLAKDTPEDRSLAGSRTERPGAGAPSLGKELRTLRREVERLRGLLRSNGIDPDTGTTPL
jgi:ATP-dependent Clp protease ATP-binding subunit ClpC